HVLFFCLLGLFVLCHSDCFFQELVIKDLANPPKGCVDEDGKERGFRSEWVRECMGCSCTKEALSCCSMIPDEATVDIPEECELVVDKDACSAKMVQKSDKTQPCYPF
ncbi:beta-microseminoprotein, partial [Poecilia formosa]|uniref:beta-microseminoprotein n=1 Tax=Poecilia formosa TaxID=48698 RepID=UPI0007BA86C8